MTSLLMLLGCAALALGVIAFQRRARPARRGDHEPRYIYSRTASRGARIAPGPLLIAAMFSLLGVATALLL